MAYLLSNICIKNYWNRTTIVGIIVGGWVVSFFEIQCILLIFETLCRAKLTTVVAVGGRPLTAAAA